MTPTGLQDNSMNSADNPDVTIIGAGPSGCAAGITLQREGIQAIVIDQATFPTHKVCGDAISNSAAKIINDLCNWEGAITSLPHQPINSAHAILPNRVRITREFKDAPGYVISREYLDGMLRNELTKSGAVLRHGVKAIDLLKDRAGNINGVKTNLGEIHSKAVLACDGYGSVAFKALGIPRPRGSALGFGFTAYFEGLDFGEYSGVNEHYFEPNLPYGYYWIFPMGGEAANVGFYQRSDQYLKTGRSPQGLLSGFIERHPERFRKAQQNGRIRSWPLPLAIGPVEHNIPGLLLAGDAAQAIDPFTGEGIWQALHTGIMAADSVILALRTKGKLDHQAVKNYEKILTREITHPSRIRRRIETGMAFLIATKLYRLRVVQTILRWGYHTNSLEMAKTLDQVF
jgi:geranylgeranyl reductase family protein